MSFSCLFASKIIREILSYLPEITVDCTAHRHTKNQFLIPGLGPGQDRIFQYVQHSYSTSSAFSACYMWAAAFQCWIFGPRNGLKLAFQHQKSIEYLQLPLFQPHILCETLQKSWQPIGWLSFDLPDPKFADTDFFLGPNLRCNSVANACYFGRDHLVCAAVA